MNEVNWLISLLVAIPLSVAGNLLTPLLQNWWASKSHRVARSRLREVEREFSQAKRFSNDRSALNSYLLVSLITVIVLFAFTNVLAGLLGALLMTPIPREMLAYAQLAAPVTSVLTILCNIMAVVRAVQAMSVYRRVEVFSRYEAETEELLAKLRASAA